MERIVANFLGDYGSIPVLLLLCVIIWFFLREIKREVAGVKDSVTSMRDDLLERIQELGKRSDEKDDCLLEELKKMEEEIRYIHKEYVRKEDHYRDLGGWRAEFKGVQERIDAVYKVVLGSEKENK